MSLKSFYQKLEDRYFNFLDKLDRKGINLYKIIDPLERRGIRTFAIFSLIILGVIVLLAFMIFSNHTVISKNSYLTFVDSTNKPITNQTITLSFSGTEKLFTTDELGIAKVSGLNKDTLYSLKINSNKYELEKPLELNFSDASNFTIYLKDKRTTVDKKIIFTRDGEQLTEYLLLDELRCSNEDSSFQPLTNIPIIDGVLIVQDVPLDCGELIPTFQFYTPNYSDLEIDDSSKVGEISLSDEIETEKGSVTIIVKDKDIATPVSNIVVTLTNANGIKAETATTNTNGIVEFNNLNVGQYFISAYDQNHTYGELVVTDGESVTIVSGQIESKEIKLEKKIIGLLKLKVIDSDNSEAIKNVKCTLFKGEQEIVSQMTDEQGLVTFGLEENISYKVTFDNANYTFRVENNLRKSENVQTIRLDIINLETIRGLLITVVDDFSKPVEFADIKLLDSENNTVLKTTVADVYGKAVITNLDPKKSYRLEAVKGKFSSGISNPFMIFEREVNEQILKMSIGEGTFNVNVRDEFGDPISTNVSIYDTFNNLEISGKRSLTDTEGNTLVRVRADKVVYFVIDNYESKFFTTKYGVEANTVNNVNIVLPKVSSSSNIEFLGLFDNKGEIVSSVSPGQSVKARFLVNVNNNYSQVVAHIRTGKGNQCDNQTNLMEQDSIYIKKIDFAGNKIYGSTSYTPCLGELTDLKIKTNRDAKWFNVVIDNPYQGTYLVDADLVIGNDAVGTLPLFYRAEFKQGNSVLRYPIDSKLGTGLLTSTKQSLYAYTKETQIFTGQSNFCDSILCYNFSIFNENTKLTKNIIDKYSAQANTSHKFSFNLNIASKALQNATLNITTGSSVLLKDYSIDAVGSNLLKGENFDSIELGPLGTNDHISGVINFNIVSDAEDVITFNLLSDGEIVFTKTILLDIVKSKTMNLEIVPRTFAPFVPNDTIIAVTDDGNVPISNADVIIKINNEQTIESGVVTDQKGLYGFILPALDLGDSVTVIVRKNGYKRIEQVFEITNNLISVVPEKVDVVLDLSKELVNINNFSLINNTALPLAITNLSLENKNDFINLSVTSQENLIDSLEQVNISLKTSLTEEGINLEVQQNIVTNLLVTLNSSALNKFWTVKIPINIRVVFGNALDSVDCLLLDPVSLELRTTNGKQAEASFTLQNNCKVSGTAVSLGKLYANLDLQNQKEVGVISLYVNNKEYILEGNSLTEILQTIDAKKKVDLKVTFKAAEIDSALRSPKIVFSTTRVNQNGVDELEATLSLQTIINNYSKCLKLPEERVAVLACNMYGGQGMYNNYYGGNINRYQDPRIYSNFGNSYAQGFNMNRYFSPNNNYNYGAGYFNQSYNGMGSPNFYDGGAYNGYVGSNLTTLYGQQYPNNFYNNGVGLNNAYGYENYNFLETSPFVGQMGMTNLMGCPQRPIFIENSCSESVDIKFSDGYGVGVDSKHKEFTLEKGQKETIGVFGYDEMGTFNLSVSAKPTSDIDGDYEFVKDVAVDVSLPLSYMPSQCIRVTPQKIDFSTKVTGYEEVKIINTCFSKGYRLLEISYLDLNALSIDGVTFLDISENLGRIEPLKVSYDTQNTQTGEIYETWSIALKRNPEIQRMYLDDYLNKYKSRTGNIDAVTIVSSLRTLGFDFGESVSLKFMLQIKLQPPKTQSMPLFNNVGMELIDNLQWLGLINKENANVFGIYGGEIDYSKFSKETLKFVDTNAELEYLLEITKDGPVVFIKVPDKYLTKDKFNVLDLKDSSEKCFMGRINQFPIEGISSKAAYIPSSEKSMFFNNEGPVEVSIDFVEKYYFKLCFKRPTKELTKIESTVYDLFKNQFTIMETLEDNSSNRLGATKIGVIANLGAEKLGLVTDTQDNGEEEKDEITDEILIDFENTCKSPDGTKSDYGYTSQSNYKKYGFDKLLFSWDSDEITTDTCNDYYCDQEQLYLSIGKKMDAISQNSGDNVTLGGIKFENDLFGEIKLNTEVISEIDCSACQKARITLKSKSILDNYIDVSVELLKKIPDEFKMLAIISVKHEDDSAFEEFIETKITTNYYKSETKIYFTLNEYLLNIDRLLDTNNDEEHLKQIFSTLDVGLGNGLNQFDVKIKKFGDLKNTYNKGLMEQKFLTKYSYELDSSSEITDIDKPGTYMVSAELLENNKVKLKILSYVSEIDSKYKENALFFNPINPNNNKYSVPFVAVVPNQDYYESNWEKMQEGYILSLEGKESKDKPTIEYFNIKPLVIKNQTLSYNLIRNENNFKENYNKKVVFVFNNYTQGKKEIDYQLQFKASDYINFVEYDPKLNTNNGVYIYNIEKDMSDYLKKYNYKLVKDLVNGIKEDNVCFKTDQTKINFWLNYVK